MFKRRIVLFGLIMLFVIPIALLAQSGEAVEIDLTKVELILLTGVGGFGVAALTEMLKRWLKASGLAAYGISLAVSAVATAYYLVQTGWNLWQFIGYTVLVLVLANGFYKVVKKPNQ